jgi:hypothetical protein
MVVFPVLLYAKKLNVLVLRALWIVSCLLGVFGDLVMLPVALVNNNALVILLLFLVMVVLLVVLLLRKEIALLTLMVAIGKVAIGFLPINLVMLIVLLVHGVLGQDAQNRVLLRLMVSILVSDNALEL